ncbi:MAG: hypothetical protein P1P84_00475 [Deferrisomatales bacterium]|nr:hypothetical protein [Deferrisomatales bacterium]
MELLPGGGPVFSELSPESLEDLERSLTRRRAELVAYPFRQGEGPPTNVFYLVSAVARLLRPGEAVDHYIDPQALPIQKRYLLRHALEAAGRLQGLVHASLGDGF